MPKKLPLRVIVFFIVLLCYYLFFYAEKKESKSVNESPPKPIKNYEKETSNRPVKRPKNLPKTDQKEKNKPLPKTEKPKKEEEFKSVSDNRPEIIDLLNKQHKTEVFFKLHKDLAIFGGDQIAGAIAEEADLDKHKYYKTALKPSNTWPGGVVPFSVASELGPELTDRVLWAIDYFNYETNIEFKPFEQDYDADAILFTYDEDLPCSSYVGRVGGVQPIYLNLNCSRQSVLHEIMHALGFVHEQQLPERAKYIKILWPNIKKEFLFNYSLVPKVMTDLYEGSEFEFSLNSVMMYEDTAFALPGKKSMKSLGEAAIDPIKEGLSKVDKERLDLLY